MSNSLASYAAFGAGFILLAASVSGDNQNVDAMPVPLQHRARISNQPYCWLKAFGVRRDSIPEMRPFPPLGPKGGKFLSMRRCRIPFSTTRSEGIVRYRAPHL